VTFELAVVLVFVLECSFGWKFKIRDIVLIHHVIGLWTCEKTGDAVSEGTISKGCAVSGLRRE
jgi:hypothetical protein